MQPRFLNPEENRVGAIERAETALGEAAQWFARRFGHGGDAELQGLLAAFLEDAQRVARLAEIETRQRLEEREDAVHSRIFRRHRRVVIQPQRRARRAVSLAEDVILLVEPAVVIKRRAPEHRAMVHHAVLHVAHDLAVTQPARFLRHAQIARVHETNELRRLVIQPGV